MMKNIWKDTKEELPNHNTSVVVLEHDNELMIDVVYNKIKNVFIYGGIMFDVSHTRRWCYESDLIEQATSKSADKQRQDFIGNQAGDNGDD